MAHPLPQGCSEIYCLPYAPPQLSNLQSKQLQDPTLLVASMGLIVQEATWLDPSPISSKTASSERGLPCPDLGFGQPRGPAALGEPVGQGPR